ncbi:FabD/lysophospholipase-like protein [Conidiobolus coronatus NRRL 28638]|uniref:FabD/lysophospholipase-like protein n=1 Tax=Conidiobolus coronatus (strain ATCC 28846 / CBS 209.66 / NRRL 28638) TaxID=796925 RepID=A0A137P2T1_CONC2|nr:FabD/lysophospholipase-like protein [Conidiobolus coronatus NRRL 28638]|eukprot:KXN69268.1 FabD/lysophospholipase-like protein [Conidiobolus coronatus NRRL 28638]
MMNVSPTTSHLSTTPSLEEYRAYHMQQVREGKRKFRILAIDGGGVRGVIPSMVLQYIEKQTGKPICELFDLVSGTSTGALLAVTLAVPQNTATPKTSDEGEIKIDEKPGNNKEKSANSNYHPLLVPRYTAVQSTELYYKEIPRIFKTNLYRKIITGFGLKAARYSSTTKRQVIEEYVGDLTLKDTLVDVLVPTFDVREGIPYFFSSWYARMNSRKNWPLRTVLDATSSAPTFFNVTKSNPGYDELPKLGYRLFTDGALTANCPALCAAVEAVKRYRLTPDQIVIVSLGCGDADITKNFEDVNRWGALNWLSYFGESLISSSMNTVKYQLQEIMPVQGYWRFQANLDAAHSSIDDSSPGNLNYLTKTGQDLVAKEKARLDEAINILVQGL